MRQNTNNKATAQQNLEAFLAEMLPDPYDFHSVKIESDFDGSDFTYSASINFLLPNGMDKTYSFPLYGMNKSDMQALTIYSIRRLLKDQSQEPYCE